MINVDSDVATNKPLASTKHRLLLRKFSIGSFLLTVLLLYLSSHLPLFDSSPDVLLPYGANASLISHLARPLLRWDAFHFAHIAQDGYVYEHEWAFFPGVPLVMTGAARILQAAQLLAPKLDLANVLISGAFASVLCGTTTTLYDLTLYHFDSPSMAFLTCLLSLLPSSPATLRFSVYSEPFFTYLSYQGMLYCTRSRWVVATLFFTLAAAFRSNGTMLCVYIIWGLIVEPLLVKKKLHLLRCLQAITLSLVILSPFLHHQYRAYISFCHGRSNDAEVPQWCSKTPPSIYAYVQDHYWNVGFLRYWTPSQLPNIILGLPPLVSIITFSVLQIRACLLPRLFALLGIRTPAKLLTPPAQSAVTIVKMSIMPHAIHALVLSLVLLFAAHTQISLRLVASLPFTYWAAAYLLIEYPLAGKGWIAWSVVWGAISIVLWAVFLPPA